MPLGSGHGLGQRPGGGLGLLFFVDRRSNGLQSHIDPHQQAARQQTAKVGHIGNLLATQQMLQQLHAHPDRQHDQGRPARVVEVEQQHVEEADAPHAVHHRIHGH